MHCKNISFDFLENRKYNDNERVADERKSSFATLFLLFHKECAKVHFLLNFTKMPLKSVLPISVSPAYEIGAHFFMWKKGGFI